MKFFIGIISLILPVSVFGSEIKNKDSEKFQQYPVERSESFYCNDLKPQIQIDFSMLYGLWYGAEVITHHDSESYEATYDSCVVVNIRGSGYEYGGQDYDYSNFDEKDYERRQHDWRVTKNTQNIHEGSQKRLHLTWDERGRALEYPLMYDMNRRGFWITTGSQRGTMLDLPYSQFKGTIQVMKAVGNHLVLTFCETLPRSQFFTIVLTKKPHNLSRDDIQSIRGLLRRRGLNVQSVRKVCKNSSFLMTPMSKSHVIAIAISALLIKLMIAK